MTDKNTVVMVIGAGRSGTSLTMQILEALGLDVSKDTLSVGEQNPRGAYEDRSIFDATRNLFGKLGVDQSLPLPEGWQKSSYADDLVESLVEILVSQLNSSTRMYCFKDPKSTLLLPLWTRVFNIAKVKVKYILSVRDPVSVCTSMVRQYNYPAQLAELYWLNHNITGLWDCSANCYISHYEDWFARPSDVLDSLVDFIGSGNMDTTRDANTVIQNVISEKLDRSRFSDIRIKNRNVNRLYEVLKVQKGHQFDHDQIMECVSECRQNMEEFSGWYIAAHNIADRQQKKIRNLEENLGKHLDLEGKKNQQEIKALKSDLRSLTRMSNKQLGEIKDLQDMLDSKNIKIQTLSARIEELNKRIPGRQNQMTILKKSRKYLLGHYMILALTKPGINTLLAPYRIIKLMLWRG